VNFQSPSDADWEEFERQLANDDGGAAKAHLAAGNPIYYTEADTPEHTCLKEYPDGRRELVTFDLERGEVFISAASPRHRSPADLLDALGRVEASTRKAQHALDDALSYIDDSNKRLDRRD
jgi:hypothetical protein